MSVLDTQVDPNSIDAVETEFPNLERLADQCRSAKRDGYASKAAIPGQIPVINEIFTSSAAEKGMGGEGRRRLVIGTRRCGR